MRYDRTRPMTRGFTLIELLVVMAIIGLLIAFILVAAGGSVRRAEEKATLGLIAKLEMGLSERIEAILLRRADIYPAHFDMASIYTTSSPPPITAPQRAQVIAQFDLVRAEIPDVFFVQNDPNYPINFAGVPYPPIPGGTNFVPLGAGSGNAALNPQLYPILGVYGATWQAMSGIHKRLGYLASGYDGVDNGGTIGLVDDLAEGVGADPLLDDPDNPKLPQIRLSALIARRLSNHQHKTARSEMLYALLVDGQGPLGSVFSADEFSSREVADTDNDGLPEFIDAWGEPLQFYRWPIYYNGDYNSVSGGPTGGSSTASYVQKGLLAYSSVSEPRQIDPLDPGQQLMAPAWFSPASNTQATIPPFSAFTAGTTYSAGANAFMTYFHSLTDINYPPPTGIPSRTWDRSGSYARRAYYSRPLILSAGPDKTLGVVQLPSSPTPTAQQLISVENAAFQLPSLNVFGQDDVSNQGLASPGGGVR